MKKINEETGCYITLGIYFIIFMCCTAYTQDFLMGGCLTLIVVLLHVLFWIIYSITPYGMKKFDEKMEKTLEQIPFTHVSGLEKIKENTPVAIKIQDKNCIIVDIHSDIYETIQLNEIKTAEPISRISLTEKDKSIIARALVGGIVFGVVGAVVGGMTGIGTHKEETINNFFKITLNNDKEILLVPFMNSENPSKLLLKRIQENYQL